LRDGSVPRQIRALESGSTSIAYIAATYLSDGSISRRLEASAALAQETNLNSGEFAYEYILLRPGRTLPQMLLEANEERAEKSLLLPDSAMPGWPISNDTLLRRLAQKLGMTFCECERGINSIIPILLTERSDLSGGETFHKRVVSLAISLQLPKDIEVEGAKVGDGMLTWMTSSRFEAEIVRRPQSISDHVRIIAGLIWDRNYPLTMSPPFEDLAGTRAPQP
jgi:hypothetical protein